MREIQAPSKPAADEPRLCPFCRSHEVATTSKVITVATYWRCGTCGQIWNHSRLQRPKYW